MACFEKWSKTELTHKKYCAVLEKNGVHLTYLEGNKHGVSGHGEYMWIHIMFLLASYWEIHCLYSQIQLLTTKGNFTK